jgi:hypothetical protein
MVVAYAQYQESSREGSVNMYGEKKSYMLHCEEESLNGIHKIRSSKSQDSSKTKDRDNTQKPEKQSSYKKDKKET